ncbi:hypothetical protein J5N97_006957 [Dioscorea zingiberensis]|uniref:Pentatricopeptide repeat-containing protein n=1 Tax=Dioscorea zingiberensis TaxID=325984 RepID=A0A9D5DB40_9LILI|nr:hypothetical protein J5N97_006957 [Dioscorea zingiberensis]
MMQGKDVKAWTSMIGGLADHGHAEDALELFSLMQRSGARPDGVTFVGVLCACSHAGLVELGLHYFHSMMKDHNIVPRIEHYVCMIDLFGRAGRVKESLEFIYSMDVQANAVVWRVLLSTCRLNLDVELAEAKEMHIRIIENAWYWNDLIDATVILLKIIVKEIQ